MFNVILNKHSRLKMDMIEIKKEKRETIIFILTCINIVATLLIIVFGYLVSKDVRDIQKQAEKRANAKEIRAFWIEMHVIDEKAAEQSKHFGDALSDFTIRSAKLLDEYDRIYQNKNTKNGQLLSSDAQYLGAYAEFIGSYAKIKSTILSVKNEYLFIRIRNNPVAKTLNIPEWDTFINQDKSVQEWCADILLKVNNVFGLINSILNDHKESNKFIPQIQENFKKMGAFIGNKPIPYLAGLSKLLEMNWENNHLSKKYNRNRTPHHCGALPLDPAYGSCTKAVQLV